MKQHQYILSIISASALCIFAGGCTKSASSEQKVASVPAHIDQNDGSIPGLDVVTPAVDGLRMKDMVNQCLEHDKTSITLSNSLGAMGIDIKDGLEPLSTPAAIANMRHVSLYGFQLTDEMLEQISSLRLISLQVKKARLSDLHAIKDMVSLQSLDLTQNALNHDAFAVLSRLPNLTHLVISSTPVDAEDLKLLAHSKSLKLIAANHCPKLSDRDIAAFHKALPSCIIFRLSEEEEKKRDQQLHEKKANWID